MKSKLLAFLLTLAACVSIFPPAAAYSEMDEAKAALDTVDIVQTCNGTVSDDYTHNYAADGDAVLVKYEPSLCMTEEMAMYLQPRQRQLMDAKFNVHLEIDTKLLEFADNGSGWLTVTFSSKFLKPWQVDEDDVRSYPAAFGYDDYKEAIQNGSYRYSLVGYEDGLFTYEVSVDKDWAQTYAAEHGYIDIPMELIIYYDEDSRTAYGYEDVPDSAGDQTYLYYNFTIDDWMPPTSATLEMKVRDDVASTVTGNPSTWKTVEARGAIDGEFTYISGPAENIGVFASYESLGYTTTLEFGNDFANGDDPIIEEWTSNVVTLHLIRSGGSPSSLPDEPESPYLDLDNHFAYIIGYPVDYVTGEPTDDMSRWPVKPEGNITRAEVATIFFRMLTDEVRSQYWSQTNPYDDVALTDWYNNAISTLTNLGVVEGYPDGGFHPTANITRAEFAAMAVRFFENTGDYTWDADAFSDIAGHWANKYINLACLLNLVNGYPDGTYRPENAITRAEAMTIVNNTLRRTPCNEGIQPVEEDMITWPDNMDAAQWYYAAVQEATNSHEYTYFTENEELLHKELWQEILPVRDWAAFEKAWSDANSAANPGEVADYD